MGDTRLVGCLLLLTCGCGEAATRSDTPGAGGSAGAELSGSAGRSSAGNSAAAGSATDGATAGMSAMIGGTAGTGAGAGTSSAIGGTAGEGADAGAAEAGSGGDGLDGSACPRWPRDRLLPTIGPLFYGPDPGPCTETGGTAASPTLGTYAYDAAGRVLNVTFPSSLRSYSYQDGALSSISYTGPSKPEMIISYAWSATSVTETVPGTGETIREYLLDEAGYPTALWVTDPTLGTRRRWARYEYVACRLTHRETVYQDGTTDPQQTADYAYDDVGHLIARTNLDGTKVEFDYGCW